MRIERVAVGPSRPARRNASPSAFSMPGGEGVAAGEVTQARPPEAIGAAAAREDGAARDAEAERRAVAMLDALARLQLARLDGQADAAALERLAVEAEGEAGADPALAAVMAGIALRARVELARRRMQADAATGE